MNLPKPGRKEHKRKQQLDDMDVKVANTHMNWKHGLHLSY